MSNESAATVPAPRPEREPTKRVRTPLWPLAVLGLALMWSFAIRAPLILNAKAHLDSDLAVDGLTLLEMLEGRWRWHFPGTPHIGIAPLFTALPPALIWGGTPEALVAGGVAIHALVVAACFALAWRCDGPRVACWSLLPVTFASTGLIWLSGRLTGGHLLSVATHAIVFFAAVGAIRRPGAVGYLLLGAICGFGLWIDSMTILSVAGAAVALVAGSWSKSGSKAARLFGPIRYLPLILVGAVVGLAPKWIGDRADPYDSYKEQFSPIWNGGVLYGHARLLALDCLPRLVAGHRIPSLRSDPPTYSIPTSVAASRQRDRAGFFDEVSTHLAGLLFATSLIFLCLERGDPASFAARLGLAVASVLVLILFILNRNIFNADNYRYLVLLIVPWSLGFGRAFDKLASKGAGGTAGACLLGLVFAAVMTVDAAYWYERFGWIKDGRPVAAHVDQPVLDWVAAHHECDGFIGSYWDVYRLSFLAGGRLKGIPYGTYPNRFPEWNKLWPAGRPGFLIYTAQRDGGGMFRNQALQDGGVEMFRAGNTTIYSWPVKPSMP